MKIRTLIKLWASEDEFEHWVCSLPSPQVRDVLGKVHDFLKTPAATRINIDTREEILHRRMLLQWRLVQQGVMS